MACHLSVAPSVPLPRTISQRELMPESGWLWEPETYITTHPTGPNAGRGVAASETQCGLSHDGSFGSIRCTPGQPSAATVNQPSAQKGDHGGERQTKVSSEIPTLFHLKTQPTIGVHLPTSIRIVLQVRLPAQGSPVCVRLTLKPITTQVHLRKLGQGREAEGMEEHCLLACACGCLCLLCYIIQDPPDQWWYHP